MTGLLPICAAINNLPKIKTLGTDFVTLFWQQSNAMTWFHAVLAIAFGIIYMFYGWKIFRVLVAISFGLLGMLIGIHLGEYLGNMVWGGIIGTFSLGLLAIPMFKWAVSALGALAGSIIIGGLWHAVHMPQNYLWVGAVFGLIVGGLLSFLIFKFMVTLITSLSGSILMASGMLQLIYLYEQTFVPPTNKVQNFVNNENWFIPLVIFLPTAISMFAQYRFIKGSGDSGK